MFLARRLRRLAMIVCCAVQWPSSHLRIFGSWLKFEARFVNRKKSMARSSTTSWWLVAVVYVPLFKKLKKLEWRPRSETRWLGLNFGPFLIPPTRCWTHETATKLTSWTKDLVYFCLIFLGFVFCSKNTSCRPVLRVFDAQLNQLIGNTKLSLCLILHKRATWNFTRLFEL